MKIADWLDVAARFNNRSRGIKMGAAHQRPPLPYYTLRITE
jgi:hypothetical protein